MKNTKATAIGIVAGDDQFDSSYLEAMLDDFIDQSADYVKASRFFHRKAFKTMPKYRQFGNIFITLLTKFSTGYYSVTDITNGCGWLRRDVLEKSLSGWTSHYENVLILTVVRFLLTKFLTQNDIVLSSLMSKIEPSPSKKNQPSQSQTSPWSGYIFMITMLLRSPKTSSLQHEAS